MWSVLSRMARLSIDVALLKSVLNFKDEAFLCRNFLPDGGNFFADKLYVIYILLNVIRIVNYGQAQHRCRVVEVGSEFLK